MSEGVHGSRPAEAFERQLDKECGCVLMLSPGNESWRDSVIVAPESRPSEEAAALVMVTETPAPVLLDSIGDKLSDVDLVTAFSRGGRAGSVYWNADAMYLLRLAENGELYCDEEWGTEGYRMHPASSLVPAEQHDSDPRATLLSILGRYVGVDISDLPSHPSSAIEIRPIWPRQNHSSMSAVPTAGEEFNPWEESHYFNMGQRALGLDSALQITQRAMTASEESLRRLANHAVKTALRLACLYDEPKLASLESALENFAKPLVLESVVLGVAQDVLENADDAELPISYFAYRSLLNATVALPVVAALDCCWWTAELIKEFVPEARDLFIISALDILDQR